VGRACIVELSEFREELLRKFLRERLHIEIIKVGPRQFQDRKDATEVVI
jgi:hypothetical protein